MTELLPIHHTHFSRDKQVRFLEALALWGGVRAACRAVPASPQTVYRHRRASHDFALAWDAALLVARPQVEDVLADRALNGIEEVVWYHGEEIGRRRRYDSRLLLAHLARLDKAEECNETLELAHDFDAALERLRRGEPVAPDYAAESGRYDEDWDDEPVTYGERWEDETLPFPERAELYMRWLEEPDEEFGEDGPDPYDIADDPDDELPDPYDPVPEDDLDGEDAPALKQRSGSAMEDPALKQRGGSAKNTIQDSVTPVTLQHADQHAEGRNRGLAAVCSDGGKAADD